MAGVWTALLTGAVIGLGAGVAPGPLLGLTITATLQGGLAAGARTALAPLVSDVPVVVLAVLVVTGLPRTLEQGLAVVGGAVVVWFGIEALRAARRAELPGPADEVAARSAALRRGVVVNLLSPHPWVFWLTIGATQLTAAQRASGWLGPVAFLTGFYGLLVGAKVAVAASLQLGRSRLRRGGYRRVLAVSGAALVAAGLVLAAEALPRS